jgi:hypothetical protein
MAFISLAAVLGKRIRSADELDSVLSFKFVNTSPSQMGELDEYRSLQQDPATKILDDRPVEDSIPPASLLYDGFGHFMDIFRHREDVCDLCTKRRELEFAVDDFAEQMTVIHDEDDKRRECLHALNEILSLHRGSKLTVADINCGAHSDGYYDGPHDAVSCVVVFKSELVNVNSIPVVELTGHVAHSHAQSMKHFKELYSGWRVPCLGLSIVGKLDIFWFPR